MKKIIFILLTALLSPAFFAQNFSIGFSTNFSGGMISEPVNSNNSISNVEQSFNIVQFGIAAEVKLFELDFLKFYLLSKLSYGKQNKAFKYSVDTPRGNYFIISDLNYLYSFNNTILGRLNLSRNVSIGIGLNTQIKFYKFTDTQDFIIFQIDNGTHEKSLFSLGPIIQTDLLIQDHLKLTVGASYSINDQKLNTFRFGSDPPNSDEYFAEKDFDSWDFYLSILYSL